jgi:hydroxymethylglutaryl-CoA lyase
VDTGIDLEALCAAARQFEELLGHPLPGQVMHAGPRWRRHAAEEVPCAGG